MPTLARLPASRDSDAHVKLQSTRQLKPGPLHFTSLIRPDGSAEAAMASRRLGHETHQLRRKTQSFAMFPTRCGGR